MIEMRLVPKHESAGANGREAELFGAIWGQFFRRPMDTSWVAEISLGYVRVSGWVRDRN